MYSPRPLRVVGEDQLTNFRRGLTGEQAFAFLKEGEGRVLIRLPVGVGKTHWIRNIISVGLTQDRADLIVIFAPRWDILREIHQHLPRVGKIKILKPRPRKRCGDLDASWAEYEQQGCSTLAKSELCARCLHQKTCSWPKQFGKALRGTRVLLATQTQLQLNPYLLTHLAQHTRAKRILVLLDEADVVVRDQLRTIKRSELRDFTTIVREINEQVEPPRSRASTIWEQHCDILQYAATKDLREGEWQVPFPLLDWVRQVQKRGRQRFGTRFRYLGHELVHLSRSDPLSRERLADGSLRFAVQPFFGTQYMLFSASIAPTLARYRLDPNFRSRKFISPFEGAIFAHPETRWLHVRSLEGSAQLFPGNRNRLLSLFAALILRNIDQNRKTLLVARKRFVASCRHRLLKLFGRLNRPEIKIITKNFTRHDLSKPNHIALINYGVQGVNLFEEVECVYCLTSYLVNPSAVLQTLRDIEPSESHADLSIETGFHPYRRFIRLEHPTANALLSKVAEETLWFREPEVILQAVGRVRPFTRPREVITQYPGDMPGIEFTQAFSSFRELRGFLGIPPLKKRIQHSRREQALLLREQGKTLHEISRELQVSLATIKRDLREEGPAQNQFL